MEKYNASKKTLKFAASPKNIVSMYKVTDPILKFFIYRYGENMMPSESEQKALDEQLTHLDESERLKYWLEQKLDSVIRAKINESNPESNYFKDTSKINPDLIIQAHGDMPHLQEAKAKYDSGDKSGAVEEIIKSINALKRKAFTDWVQKMEGYDPIFSFMLLSQVIDSSPSDKTSPPPVVFNKEAVDTILNDVVNEGLKDSPIPFHSISIKNIVTFLL